MAISRVEVTPITYKPADGSSVHECGPLVLTKIDSAVVEIFTEEGLVGIGVGNPVDAAADYNW